MSKAQSTSGYCEKCEKNVVVTRPGTNHILHLLLSLLTGGIWIIVWIICAIKIGDWQCRECGESAKGNPLRLSTPNTRKCPHCAESIKSEATKCRYCLENVTPLISFESRKKEIENMKKDSIVGWTIIVLILFIVLIIYNY